MAGHLSSHRSGYITPEESRDAVQEVSEQSEALTSMDSQSTLRPQRSIVPMNSAVQNDTFEVSSTLHRSHTLADVEDDEPISGQSSFINFILSPRRSNVFELSQFDLRLLNEASQLPPITMTELNLLEVSNIIGSPRMRYDLNFDKDTKFSPDHPNEKREKATKYWEALAIELALYIECALKKCDGCLLHDNVPLPDRLWRMKGVFDTLKDIMMNVMREEDGPAIEQSLDVRLLMQQLNKGVCDLKSLSNWFGRTIKGSCSPIRDGEVDKTVDRLNQAIDRADPSELARGLESLFALFETMKLDIANHQLRFLRILMISDSAEYAREHFTSRIHGLSYGEPRFSTDQLETATAWYVDAMKRGREEQDSDDPNEEELFPPGSHNIILLGRGIRDLIISREELAITFEYDQVRLQLLREAYQQALFSEQVAHVVESSLKARGLRAELYETHKQNLLSQISQLRTTESLTTDDFRRSAALQIVRVIYPPDRTSGLPSVDESEVYKLLCEVFDPSNSRFMEVENKLCFDLDLLLEKEITEIYDMPSLEISNRYEGSYPPPTFFGRPQSPRIRNLHSLAARIAHMTVLHWRIWAPILDFLLAEDEDGEDVLVLDHSSGGEAHSHEDENRGRESAARATAAPSAEDGGDQSETESENMLQTRAAWQVEGQ